MLNKWYNVWRNLSLAIWLHRTFTKALIGKKDDLFSLPKRKTECVLTVATHQVLLKECSGKEQRTAAKVTTSRRGCSYHSASSKLIITRKWRKPILIYGQFKHAPEKNVLKFCHS